MRRVDHSPYAFLMRHAHHLLPRQEHARVRHNRVDHRHDLIPLALQVFREFRREGRDVGELRVGALLLHLAELRAEDVDDLRVREREVERDVDDLRARTLRTVGEVRERVGDRGVGRARCESGAVSFGLSVGQFGWRDKLASHEYIAVTPFEVAQDGVQRVCGVGGEDHLVSFCTDELS